jgi:glycosyltransferase involved in cell wall biosynthesis
MDLVSVVIPTLHRPNLLRRAVASALAQTWSAVEVIVIIDGIDPATRATLAAIADPRLIVLQNERSQGPGVARNTAARVARGTWLAFLDDDDEWLPDKLVRQLEGISSHHPVILSCRCRVQTPSGTYIWPRRLPEPNEPVDAYLFGRRSLLRGEAYLATPTFVLPTWLFHRSGFGNSWQYEDTTLLLRATRRESAVIIMRPEVLAIIHADVSGSSLGSDFSWEEGLDWMNTVSELFTPRGGSGFCLVTLGSQAARVSAWRAAPILMRRAWRYGTPTLVQLLLFMSFWVIPQNLRRRLHAWSLGR